MESATAANAISTAQKASWNKFSTGWKKWDAATMAMIAPHGEAIMDHLGASGTCQVLDVAAGTGEPGLSIAKHLSDGGTVHITDLSERMLEVAKEKAAAIRGQARVEFREADANALPFPDSKHGRGELPPRLHVRAGHAAAPRTRWPAC
jgi:ubiquinone/menaquinone biosynthesis C-methylase UbiE